MIRGEGHLKGDVLHIMNKLLLPLGIALGMVVIIGVIVWAAMQMQQTQTRASKFDKVSEVDAEVIKMENELRQLDQIENADELTKDDVQ